MSETPFKRGSRIRLRVFALVAVASALFATAARAAPMTFRMASSGAGPGEQWIVADGQIVLQSGDALRRFLAAQGIRPGGRMEVYLNSGGGSLIGGIRLGEVIRELGLGTRVARSVPLKSNPRHEDEAPGECYSACSFAFLGGKWRLAAGGSLGVHQHYDREALEAPQTRQLSASDLSASQVMSGILAEYVVRMGVDARFLTLASITRPNGIYRFTADELATYSITFNDLAFADWTLEPFKEGLIAKTLTRNGENQATVYCRGDRVPRMLLTAPYRAKFSEPEIVRGAAVSLFGTDIPASDITAQIDREKLLLEFRLPPGIDPDRSKAAGMSAAGATRALFEHELPKKNFGAMLRLIGKNCI